MCSACATDGSSPCMHVQQRHDGRPRLPANAHSGLKSPVPEAYKQRCPTTAQARASLAPMLPACSPSKVRRSERNWYHQSGLRLRLPEGRRLAQLNVAVRRICEPVACRVVSVCFWLPAFGAKLRRLARARVTSSGGRKALLAPRTSFSLRDCQASTRPHTSPCRRVSQGNLVKHVAKGRPVTRQATAGHTGHSGMHFG